MRLTRTSPCKVNFVLNILGRRADGFHELETLFFPAPLTDLLEVESAASGIELSCSHPGLPTDASNLVHRAATSFFAAAHQKAGLQGGARLRLEKRLPLAAGLGAGSANAAVTLLMLNELYGGPLAAAELDTLAAGLGSDVNFFLQPNPALAFGRGERIQPLAPFGLLRGAAMLLFHPGFGVATPWAFSALPEHPEALNGAPGRAARAAAVFAGDDRAAAGASLYNGLEAPVLTKYPILAIIQEELRACGAWGALMSGSGSTTFGLFSDRPAAERAAETVRSKFGAAGWLAIADL